VVYGEAMLTMQGQNQKVAIIAQAARLLRLGVRYGIRELCLVPDELSREKRDLVEHDLATTIHVGARPNHSGMAGTPHRTWLQHNTLCYSAYASAWGSPLDPGLGSGSRSTDCRQGSSRTRSRRCSAGDLPGSQPV